MKVKILILILIIFPFFAVAGNGQSYFKAKIVEVKEEVEKTREDGSKYFQQDLKLEIIKGERKGRNFSINNIGELDVINMNQYEVGDKVIVSYEEGLEGDYYQIIDYVRTASLWWLGLIFALIIILVARFKGFKSLVGLFLSFLVIMKFIVPQILNGANPLLIGILGSFVILIFLIYITEGWTKISHISIFSIVISLMITAILSVVFTNITKLTGLGGDEVMYLIGSAQASINFQGLLLAGIIIGTLGVLDDLVISQVSLVKEIRDANKSLKPKTVYKKAMKVGVTHIGAMTNTLFLAYAGVSLPLLLIFGLNNPPFLTFSDVINNELIATEIVRTLIGSIGLILAAPIATILSVRFFVKK